MAKMVISLDLYSFKFHWTEERRNMWIFKSKLDTEDSFWAKIVYNFHENDRIMCFIPMGSHSLASQTGTLWNIQRNVDIYHLVSCPWSSMKYKEKVNLYNTLIEKKYSYSVHLLRNGIILNFGNSHKNSFKILDGIYQSFFSVGFIITLTGDYWHRHSHR